MKDKIVQLMKSEGLTPSRLAEVLEIQPSGISHLVSGRNKPSFELLKKILRSFPNINPYWLLLDDDKMYCDPQSPIAIDEVIESREGSAAPSIVGDLFSAPTPQAAAVELEQPSPTPAPIAAHDIGEVYSNIEPKRAQLLQVILLYSDGSCTSYYTQSGDNRGKK